MIYRDIPIPGRRAAAGCSAAPPEGFSVLLRLDGEELVMEPSIAGCDEEFHYEGRGLFRFGQTPLSFTVAALSILDPFLWDRSRIAARDFKIVLRVIVPKLIREGMQLRCELSLSDHPPVCITVGAISGEGTAVVQAKWAHPRRELVALGGLDEYVLGGNVLYRASMRELRELPKLPEEPEVLGLDRLRPLGRICDRMGLFFDGDGVTALRALGRGLPMRTAPTPTMPLREEKPEVDEAFRDFHVGDVFVPTVERKTALAGPALESAEFFAQSRQPTSKYAFFLSEARTMKDLRGSEASRVPFTCYWPVYSSMNRAQKAWYFYWRGQFLDGNVLKTDLAYIFVAVYELINNTVAAPAEALERLLRLWEGYRGDFPYLDRVMPGWCVDYMLLNDLGTDFDALHERIPFAIDGQTHLVELFCGRRMGEGLHTLPLEVLSTLSGYAMDKSRFVAGREALAADAVRKAVRAAEELLKSREGRDVFDYFRPPRQSVQWETFRGAVCGQQAGRRMKLTYFPYARSEDFREWLSNILRHTENLLRKHQRFPGRLRCTEMPAGLADAIARALALEAPPKPVRAEAPPAVPAAPREPIRIDLDRARALEDASWENTRRLLEALGEETCEVSGGVDDTVVGAGLRAGPSSSDATGSIANAEKLAETGGMGRHAGRPLQNDHDASGAPETDAVSDDPYAALLHALSPLQTQVLRALLAGEDASALCMGEMTFPEAVAEEINILAGDHLGDLLIESTTLQVFEDYAEEITERMK